jgi:hypothetical protein
MDRDEHSRDIAHLVIIGSDCVGLERIIERLEEEGLAVKAMKAGSTAGLLAAKRGECDVAPIHLIDPGTGEYNKPFMSTSMVLVRGYRRYQGIIFRPGDHKFEVAFGRGRRCGSEQRLRPDGHLTQQVSKVRRTSSPAHGAQGNEQCVYLAR